MFNLDILINVCKFIFHDNNFETASIVKLLKGKGVNEGKILEPIARDKKILYDYSRPFIIDSAWHICDGPVSLYGHI